jgi:UDP-2-acetamido-2-deoxy-ribo-hexuluronate aminotransferase
VNVPFIDLKRVARLVEGPVLEQWQRLVAGTEFVGGPTVAALERKLGEALGVRHAITCSSGTDALYIALQALGIGPGKKVAVPNLTFWAPYEAIVQVGATPVLVEIDPVDLQMDLEELRRGYAEIGFDAVILVHLMGWASARVAEFRDFCRKKGIPLLEDGAQSWGVKIGGESVYAGAEVSTLSFYPAKVVGGCMDGGAMFTNDAELATLMRKLCNHGRATHYSYSHVGWNSRMGGVHAAWLLAVLDHAGEIVRQRSAFAAQYDELFQELSDEVTGYRAPPGVEGNGYLSVCTLERAELDAVVARLGEAGVGTGRVYPATVDVQPPAAGALRAGDLRHGHAFCANVLNLPLFYGMTDDEFEYVQVTLRRVLEEVRA